MWSLKLLRDYRLCRTHTKKKKLVCSKWFYNLITLIWKAEWRRNKETGTERKQMREDREREREGTSLLICSANAHKCQGWVRTLELHWNHPCGSRGLYVWATVCSSVGCWVRNEGGTWPQVLWLGMWIPRGNLTSCPTTLSCRSFYFCIK